MDGEIALEILHSINIKIVELLYVYMCVCVRVCVYIFNFLAATSTTATDVVKSFAKITERRTQSASSGSVRKSNGGNLRNLK